MKNQSTLPKEGLWMIRYHSFYPLAISTPLDPASNPDEHIFSDGIARVLINIYATIQTRKHLLQFKHLTLTIYIARAMTL
jgi:hypothetical protein